ncbi:MAG: HD domain-containing protein [Treponema sp.]|nr:HD domain-containing protein [Treponema sp.]
MFEKINHIKKISHIKIPPVLKKMYQIFSDAGFSCYLVGGAVRDTLMGKEVHDYDVATDALPQDVQKLFRRVIPTGIEHGTVTVILMGHHIETTTFRNEGAYSDSRYPDNVSYTATIEEDLSRRDFTMNAIAVNLLDGSIVDPFNGLGDIKQKCIRAVGKAYERFCEDGLRPVRAIRFAAQLEFTIEQNTYSDISKDTVLSSVKKISVERFRDEFCKILLSRTPSTSLRMLEESGILEIFIPELLAGRNCKQQDARGFHNFDVLDHLYYACDGAPRTNLILRLAALFHDVGKPYTKTEEKTEAGILYHFYGHEKKGEELTRIILSRLRFPSKTINDVSHLVKEHMFHYESTWSSSAVRRFIVRVGKDYIDDLFNLRLADMYGMKKTEVRLHDSPSVKLLLEFKNRIQKVQEEKSALSLKDLAVNGNDLLKIGIPAGKTMGHILRELFNTVLDDPSQNEKDILIKIAKNIAPAKENF